jgi:hypothetical protein
MNTLKVNCWVVSLKRYGDAVSVGAILFVFGRNLPFLLFHRRG